MWSGGCARIKITRIWLYYYNNKKIGEIDFLIEKDNQVIPIEVKSGKDYKRHSTLNNLLELHNYSVAYIFCNENIRQTYKKIYLPIYLIMFLENQMPNLNQKIKLDISKLI
ncbi:DUF4143 domain-containing protein [Metamycoplasma equirhinis]|uniref:DUF4143 domain-containing protein n=1 Tax=Metamycoplasma equirhinis TaxID=92402 RepID=UPI0035933B53